QKRQLEEQIAKATSDHDAEIERLETEHAAATTALEAQIKVLGTEHAEATAALNAEKTRLEANHAEQIEGKEQELATLKEELTAATTALAAEKTQLEDNHAAQIEGKEQELAKLKEEHAAAKREYEARIKELGDSHEAAIIALAVEKTQLEANHAARIKELGDSHEAATAALEDRIAKATTEHEGKEQELATLKEELTAATTALAAAKKDQTDLKEQFKRRMDELRKQIKEKQLALDNYLNQVDKLTQDINHQELSIAQLTQAKLESESEILEKNQTLDDMAKNLDANELAKNKLEQKVLELKSSLNSAQHVNIEQNSKIENLKKSIIDKDSTIERLKSKISELTQANQELNEALEIKKADLSNKEQQLKESQRQLVAKRNEIDKLNETIKNYDIGLQRLTDDYSKKLASIRHEYAEKIDELKSEIARLNTENRDKISNEEATAMFQLCSDQRETIAALNNEKATMTTQIDKQQQKVSDLASQITMLEDKLATQASLHQINTHKLTTENEKLRGVAEKQKLKLTNQTQHIKQLTDCISEKDAEIARLRALLSYHSSQPPVRSITSSLQQPRIAPIETQPDETINDDTIAIYQQRIKGWMVACNKFFADIAVQQNDIEPHKLKILQDLYRNNHAGHNETSGAHFKMLDNTRLIQWGWSLFKTWQKLVYAILTQPDNRQTKDTMLSFINERDNSTFHFTRKLYGRVTQYSEFNGYRFMDHPNFFDPHNKAMDKNEWQMIDDLRIDEICYNVPGIKEQDFDQAISSCSNLDFLDYILSNTVLLFGRTGKHPLCELMNHPNFAKDAKNIHRLYQVSTVWSTLNFQNDDDAELISTQFKVATDNIEPIPHFFFKIFDHWNSLPETGRTLIFSSLKSYFDAPSSPARSGSSKSSTPTYQIDTFSPNLTSPSAISANDVQLAVSSRDVASQPPIVQERHSLLRAASSFSLANDDDERAKNIQRDINQCHVFVRAKRELFFCMTQLFKDGEKLKSLIAKLQSKPNSFAFNLLFMSLKQYLTTKNIDRYEIFNSSITKANRDCLANEASPANIYTSMNTFFNNHSLDDVNSKISAEESLLSNEEDLDLSSYKNDFEKLCQIYLFFVDKLTKNVEACLVEILKLTLALNDPNNRTVNYKHIIQPEQQIHAKKILMYMIGDFNNTTYINFRNKASRNSINDNDLFPWLHPLFADCLNAVTDTVIGEHDRQHRRRQLFKFEHQPFITLIYEIFNFNSAKIELRAEEEYRIEHERQMKHAESFEKRH
ncbi:MAG: hypothetical protein ACON35_08275, partial [Candidatus Marinamargulisbacteria bacterium]